MALLSITIYIIFLTKMWFFFFFFVLSYPMNKLLCESIVYCDFYWSYCSLWASWLTIKHLFVVVCLYSSGKTFIAHWLQGNQMTWLCSVCRNHNPVLSSCMTYHWMCHKSNTRVSHVEQELITLPNHPSSLPPPFW